MPLPEVRVYATLYGEPPRRKVGARAVRHDGPVDLGDAEQLARYQMALHGLSGWDFRFDRATRRFGCCNFSRRTISLSRSIVLLNPADRVRATVLHEIAHALAGPGAGHGKAWREIALRIGSDGRRCYGEEVAVPAKPTARSRSRARRPGVAVRRAFVVNARGIVSVPRTRKDRRP